MGRRYTLVQRHLVRSILAIFVISLVLIWNLCRVLVRWWNNVRLEPPSLKNWFLVYPYLCVSDGPGAFDFIQGDNGTNPQ
jgi:hypothetical protein